jgi:hypothetical protein
LLLKMDYLFAGFAKRANGGHRNAHVGQKLHAAGLENGFTSSLASAEA